MPSSSTIVLRRATAVLTLAIAGLLLAVLADGAVATIGVGLIGVAVVLLMAWVFYEVGRSEDREREREARRGPG